MYYALQTYLTVWFKVHSCWFLTIVWVNYDWQTFTFCSLPKNDCCGGHAPGFQQLLVLSAMCVRMYVPAPAATKNHSGTVAAWCGVIWTSYDDELVGKA